MNVLESGSKKSLETYITARQNLEILEDCLDQISQEHLKLRKQKSQLNFGDPIEWNNFWELLPDVTDKTEKFLGIEHLPDPKYSVFDKQNFLKHSGKVGVGASVIALAFRFNSGFQPEDILLSLGFGVLTSVGVYLESMNQYSGSQYSDKREVISIGARNTISAVGHISHEYTHHAQFKRSPLSYKQNSELMEGHAHAVSSAVCRMFADSYDNPAYLYEDLEFSAKFLKDTYTMSCRKNGIHPRESITDSASGFTVWERTSFPFFIISNRYKIGISAMHIAERQHGPQVHRDILAGDFSFLKEAA